VEGVIAAAFGAEPLGPVNVDPRILGVLLSPWARILAFVLGAAFGSFANVVIYRVPQGLSIVKPGSRCPRCETPIPFYDNIPVLSYLWLRGRCRSCKERFSSRYLVVELLSGLLSFSLYVQYVHVPLVQGGGIGWLPWLLWFAFGLALLIVIYVDLDWWLIPNQVVLPVAALGLIVAAVDPDVLGTGLVDGLASAAAGYLLFAGLRFVWYKLRGIEGLGLGDAKLLVMVAAFTGWRGLFWTVSAGAIQGLLVAIPMQLMGHKLANTDLQEVHGDDPELGEEDPDAGVMGKRVPFGPFLALAALEFVLLQTHVRGLLNLFFFGG
jgi:leader peptidase (prepilin peptidase)/N-methyltransferase